MTLGHYGGVSSTRRLLLLRLVIAGIVLAVIGTLLYGKATAGTVIFDSNFAAKGISAYAAVIHPERISIVNDPVLGSARKVAKMTVYDSDRGPTKDPRAQLETPRFWNEGEAYYVGLSVMFGRDWNWRMCSTCWVTFHQVYGPPYNAQGPTNLNVKANNPRGEPRMTWERTGRFGFDHPFEMPIRPGKWYDIVWHERLSRDPGKGFVELWINGGRGWRHAPLNLRNRLTMATKIRANGSPTQGNSSNIQLYRRQGITKVATMYFAEHRVGTSFDMVAPHSYP